MMYTKSHKHYLYSVLALCFALIAALASSPAPTRAAAKSPDPSYDGTAERIDCSQIAGWALDQNAPNESINVDIYDGPNLIATVPANRFRRDPENPNHGFIFLTPSSLKDGKIHNIFVRFSGTFIDLVGSPALIACNSSVFPTATPQSTASGQGSTWEQGLEISSSMNGIITKVRFWRSAGEPMGGHTARIWTNTGVLLKTAPFSETSSPGWQYATVNFPFTAGVRYRITYNIHQEVAKTFNVFTNGPITKGPLTGWGSYYGTPAGTFPTSGSTSNLFADVVFNSPR